MAAQVPLLNLQRNFPGPESTSVDDGPDSVDAAYFTDRNANGAVAVDGADDQNDETVLTMNISANSNVIIKIDDDDKEKEDEEGGGGGGSENKNEESDLNLCYRGIHAAQKAVVSFTDRHREAVVRAALIGLLLLYLAYVAYAMTVHFGDEGSVRLVVCTVFGLLLLAVNLARPYVVARCRAALPDLSVDRGKKIRTTIRWMLYVVSVITMATLLIVMVAVRTPGNLVSLAGLFAFILITWITSVDPTKVNWHPVFWGFSLQFYFGIIIKKTSWGYGAFVWLGDRVSEFLSSSDTGASFIFGSGYREHFFAFSILPVIVFFSSVISVLYYLGIMQIIIRILGRILSFCMGTTPAESLNAAANIFVSMTEAPMMIRPFIDNMTKSELHAVMTGGFATVAGSAMAAYIGFGVPANHLIAASVMSAPAALAISKLTYPETEVPLIQADDKDIKYGDERNLIEAISAGAIRALPLVASVAVNIISFLSVLKFVNASLAWFGDRVDVKDLSFQMICSYLLYPVAIFMGTDVGPDCRRVAQLVGIKTFTNELIAYNHLQALMENRQVWDNYSSFYDVTNPTNVIRDGLDVNLTQWNRVLEGGLLSPRSEVIAMYALCGFSNFGSMGILLGGMTAMAPHRNHDLASIVLRAMIAGNVACFVTACIAGLFFEQFE